MCVPECVASNVIVYINIQGTELNQISGKEHSTHTAGHIHAMSHRIIRLAVRQILPTVHSNNNIHNLVLHFSFNTLWKARRIWQTVSDFE